MVAAPAPPAVARYVPALTGLRAVAAYTVFLHHYNPAPAHTLAHRLFAQGYVGVSLFFVLSGFLIYHRYAEPVYVRTGWSWRGYLRNRFARIVPLYILLLLITVGAGLWRGQPTDALTLALNLTLLKGWLPDYVFSGIPQSWSLTVELSFYVLAPALFRANPPRRRTGRAHPRRAHPPHRRTGRRARWLVLMLAGLPGGLLIGGWLAGATLPTLAFVSFYTLVGRSFEFVVGIVLARQWHRGNLPRLSYGGFAGWGLVGVCVLSQATAPAGSPVAAYVREFIVYNYVLPVGWGLALWHLLQRPGWLSWGLSRPLMQALGRSSYAFYLIHLGVVPKLLTRTGLAPTRWLLFGALVLLAYGLYVGVERPLQRWLRSRS